ncbi:MAG: beta-mannosidase [Rikenellaceae bacterium]|jgi:mannan endo-1,4-beta-mannosidase|nr:beta-mannosidase [Rikenellaceae bacterium]
MRLSSLFISFALIGLVCSCKSSETTTGDFVSVEQGRFVEAGQELPYFVGMNFWYGAILGSQGEGGDRERLHRELDRLQSIGANNLRILVGADGRDGVPTKVEPTLQTSPGVYNDTILDGLDYLMSQLAKRDMKAVLYLNNAWEWSGGFSQYLAWAEGTTPVIPAVEGYAAYVDYVAGFLRSERAKELFAGYVRDIVSRTNRYTGLAYADDPTIFSWQICNEPRAFSPDNKELLYEWIASTSSLIKSLDANHLVSVGSEGSWGCEGDIELWGRILALDNVDYGNIHIGPYNWGWLQGEDGTEQPAKYLDRAIENTRDYIAAHVAEAKQSGGGKPVVLEEFGFPRDSLAIASATPTTLRDAYYRAVMAAIEQSAVEGGLLAGCNVWAWGGEAQPVHELWHAGDPYTGDPAHEAQGLYSVFATDPAVELIREINEKLGNL